MAETAENGVEVTQDGMYEYPAMTKTLGKFKLEIEAGGRLLIGRLLSLSYWERMARGRLRLFAWRQV